MADTIARVDVVFLAYDPSRPHGTAPAVTLDNVCTVSRYELQKHRRLKRSQRTAMATHAYRHYKWYNGVLMAELQATTGRPLLRAYHWYIETSSEAAFRIDGHRYGAVSLIIAPHTEHWYGADAGPSSRTVAVHGSRVRILPDAIEVPPTQTPPDCRINSFVPPERRHRPPPLGTIAEE